MFPSRESRSVLVILGLVAGACAPQAAPQGEAGVPAPRVPKTLNVVLVGEPRALTIWQESTTGGVVNLHEAITNALLAYDANSRPIPRLAVEVPSVDRGTWKVYPDGTMETIYKLRPNAVWHDGTPFTSRDVAFSARAQVDPRVEINPSFRALSSGGADRVDTLDDQTAVIHWSKTYGFADALTFWDFLPLPAHVLEEAYDRAAAEFPRQPYWSDATAFVGTGPYRLASWERGSLMDLQVFDRYYLGKPNIDRIVVNFVQDNNIAIARVLTGDYDMAWGANWDRPGMDLVRSRGIGDFVSGSQGVTHIAFQFKDVAQPPELRDVLVRRAMAHATDREAINQVDADGGSMVADSWIDPRDPRYRDAEPYITKYPYEPQRAVALFADAGWTRGTDGRLRNSEGRTFTCEIRGQLSRRSGEVTADAWRGVGIDAVAEERPAGIERDLAVRANFKCVEESYRSFGRVSVQHLHGKNAMLPERGYVGNNRGAYMNPELDRLIDGFFAATRDTERLRFEWEMVGIITSELPILTTIYNVRNDFQKTGVSGLAIKTGFDIISSVTWNVHQWEKQ